MIKLKFISNFNGFYKIFRTWYKLSF